jgi:hypothetical protein
MVYHNLFYKGDLMKLCKCGTTIDFITMESGKKMPVEIEKPIIVAIKAEPFLPGADVYKLVAGVIPHWKNCPYSKQFKKE